MRRLSYPTDRNKNPGQIAERERDILVRRAVVLQTLFFLLFAGLTFRLYSLQFLAHDKSVGDAQRNVEKRIVTDPVRGRVFDRNGQLLVSNEPYYRLVLDRSWGGRGADGISSKECTQSLLTLAGILGWSKAEQEEALHLIPSIYRGSVPEKSLSASGYIILKDRLSPTDVILIEENAGVLPGIRLEERETRRYYRGRLACHILGYTGPISREDYDKFRDDGYRMNDWIGRDGLERAYDRLLRGLRGESWQRRYANNLVEEEVLEKRVPPTPGEDFYLSLDSALQSLAEQLLEGKKGGIAAIQPFTGQVLALASSPGFDLNLFRGGIDSKDWETLRTNPEKPLVDRATGKGGGGYPPGSVFKIVTSIAALEEGLITPESTFHCSGGIQVGRKWKRCHKRSGHGAMDLDNGFSRSCDVYYYHVGELLGPELMAKYATGLGLGRKSGLPAELHEAPGLVPDPAWKRMYSKWGKWGRGDTLNTAIGQGFLLVTPLQIAVMTAFVANGGTLLEPPLVSHRRNARGELSWEAPITARETVPVSTDTLDKVREAMRSVVQSPSGTGRGVRIPNLTIAGKTGTAEHYRKPSDAWFTCYAPFEKPEIAIAIVIEGGGHGGETAGPLAQQMLLHFFRDRLENEEQVSSL